jgi:lipopolysaccharide export system protein LptC
MRIKAHWMLLIAAVVLLCLVGWGGSRAQNTRNANREYKIVTKYGVSPNADEFNKLGAEGWELVMREESLNERRRVDYFFKRAR